MATNIEARIVELSARRRAHTATRAELHELHQLEGRSRRLVEWILEPTDEHGDVIDPQQGYKTQAAAQLDVSSMFAQFPAAAYVDLAKLTLTGSVSDGVTDRLYEYRERTYRDGRRVELTTDRDGLSPVEVTP